MVKEVKCKQMSKMMQLITTTATTATVSATATAVPSSSSGCETATTTSSIQLNLYTTIIAHFGTGDLICLQCVGNVLVFSLQFQIKLFYLVWFISFVYF